MKAFFHTDPFRIDDSLLAKIFQVARSAKVRIQDACQAIGPALQRNPDARLGLITLAAVASIVVLAAIGLLLTAVFNFGNDSMPNLASPEKGEAPVPKAVTAAARETFDDRFVEYKGDLYTIVVHYRRSVSSQFGEMMHMFGGGEFPMQSTTSAPLIIGIDLIQIKDPRTEVHPSDISDADALNDIKWHGSLQLRGNVERRRQLDLTRWLQAIVSDKENSPIPWIEQPLVLADPVFVELTRERNEEDAKREQAQAELENNPFAFLLGFPTKAQQEISLGYLKEEAWADWRECGSSCYQNTTLELRGNNVIQSTLESAEDALLEANQVSVAPLHTGLLEMANQDNNKVFLTKPNLKALRQAGLLDD